jgi:hypothetical protein
MITGRLTFLSSPLSQFCCSAIRNASSKGATCRRAMASKPLHPPVGSDPLDIFRKECSARKRCDDSGRRLPDALHWAFSLAFGSSRSNMVRFHSLIYDLSVSRSMSFSREYDVLLFSLASCFADN